MKPTASRHAPRLALIVTVLLTTFGGGGRHVAAQTPVQPTVKPTPGAAQESGVYRPTLAVPEALAPFVKYLEPGNDAFTTEREAAEIEARLGEMGAALRQGPAQAARIGDWLLAPGFRGGRLLGADDTAVVDGPLEVRRAKPAPAATLDARAFGAELRRLVDGLDAVTVTEFLVTSIDAESPSGPAPEPGSAPASGLFTTDVRYDIVGGGGAVWRAEHVGVWRMRWRRAATGWQVVEWATTSRTTSRARRPIFSEVTAAALGSNESFRRQLTTGLDAWMSTFDSVLTRDSNGHHGVSIGDADGDGLEDLYIGQPSGLPNRLFRARGDGGFEDVTERAGLGVLDDTAQSLFADVDNDGDQDLVLATSAAPLLFANDGGGRFTPIADAFRFHQPLKGVLTGLAMADYDRDGFLDLYLCVYSYFFGAGEDKAGTPAPYYDARNGPPGVLFHNDGRGRFVEATKEAGLDAGNDRYHFAATWADYDEDGWPDLLVANDFGTKSLYHNRGRRDGKVTFEDVAAQAGVLDHGAGMSAAFLDYDNDGRLDIYTGNIWSTCGRRVTASPLFQPDASADVRALYRRHTRGNSLFRNLGDGRFEDKTLEAGVEMGRWAWSSDALDFDSDGWDDLYVANGMLTREGGPEDLEGFFWRQVVTRSPLTRVVGTPYDEAWRAMNQWLITRSIASRQRNVVFRNDGHGRFDDVAGAVGLDLDQDGRGFAVFDLEGDGDPDLAVMAARQAPQLRIFRNDFGSPGAALAIRLTGTTSNRDAIGARVTVETDHLRRVRIVQAGSGFISQHSKELLVGLGPSRQIRMLTVEWPSGTKQTFTDVPLGSRLRLVEGGTLERQPLRAASTAPLTPPRGGPPPSSATRGAVPQTLPRETTWMYEPFPAPDFSLPDVGGTTRSLASLRGRPAVLLFWSAKVAGARAAVDALARGGAALTQAGVGALAIAIDEPATLPDVRTVSAGTLPVILASRELALSYAILNRHLFMNRQALRLPTALLLDAAGRVVKIYRERVDVSLIVRDAGAIEASSAERLARALPFPGAFHTPQSMRDYLPYGRTLLDEGLDSAAVTAFALAAQASPNASTLYRLGTLLARTGDAARARAAFERALALQPDLAEASNDLGALLAQGGDLDAAITRFRAALAATPEYPDALNNLGYALLLTGRQDQARGLYVQALALQPDFPEALNNLGLLLGRTGDLTGAERYFRDALARRADYGEAANNLALVLVSRGQTAEAVGLLQSLIDRSPQFEATYVTLAKIYLSGNQVREGIGVLERLLQRNPTHPVALELLRQYRPR
jgi:Flp pilus assembly protein TadD